MGSRKGEFVGDQDVSSTATMTSTTTTITTTEVIVVNLVATGTDIAPLTLRLWSGCMDGWLFCESRGDEEMKLGGFYLFIYYSKVIKKV